MNPGNGGDAADPQVRRTGPEHYVRAQELLALVEVLERAVSGKGPIPSALAGPIGEARTGALATAQVHATLALAAATAAGIEAPDVWHDWRSVGAW